MRTLSDLARPRARVAAVAVMISVGVAVSVGVGHAAPTDPGMANSDSTASAPASAPAPADAQDGGDQKADDKSDKGGDGKDGKGKDGKGKHKDGKSDKGKPESNMVAGTPCTKSADACVDLAAQKAWLIDGDGKVIRGPVPITSGKPGHETPRGVFDVLYKDVDHRSREFDNAPMPYSVFFVDSGIAFHEGSLSAPSSGCIHLSHEDAMGFFDFLEPDDEVQIH